MTVNPTKISVLFFLILITVSSCGKKWNYFQEKETSSNNYERTEVAKVPNTSEHILTTGDIIGVNIKIAEMDLSGMDARDVGKEDIAIKGFLIGEDSLINHPFVGEIKVAGITVKEAEQLIKDTLTINYKSPKVNVTLNGYRVTFLGEVGQPGVHFLQGNHVSIIDGIATVGDINQFGDPSNVKIMRNVEGIRKTVVLDLTNLDVFSHPYFYLESNDIVYVGDLPKRVFRENITLISTLITVVNSIAILSLRLNVK